MNLFEAAILGLVQGITEFLPISSSAHLILVPALLGWSDQGVAFDLAVHLGTLAAVLIYFRRDVIALTRDTTLSLLQRRTVGTSRLGWQVVAATIPTAVVGALLLDAVDAMLRSVSIIAINTLIFGLLLGLADWRGKRQTPIEGLSWRNALLIGAAQVLALLPGTSRSGITLTAGLLLGMTREAGARFSFLLAIPITAVAAASKLLQVATDETPVPWGAFAFGTAISFITAILAIHYFLQLLNRFGMMPYVVYRVALAGVIYFVLIR